MTTSRCLPIFIGAALGALILAPSALAEDWPTFLGPQQNAHSAEVGLWFDWPQEGPPQRFVLEVGEGYSMPAIAGGKLVHFDRTGDTARLTAYDARSGARLWRETYPSTYVDHFDFSGGPRATPVIADVQVYAFGVDGVLRCHDLETGKVLWEVRTEERYGVVQNFFGVASTPLVWQDLLIVPVGGSPAPPEKGWNIHEGRVEPNGSGIVAFDRRTGREVYQAIDDLASYASPILRPATATRAEEIAWFGRERLWLFDPRTGAVRASFPWRARKVYSVNAATPVLNGDQIFLSESYEKGGVLLEEGPANQLRVVWADPPRRGQAMANHWNTSVLHEGVLYGSSGEKSGSAELRAVDWDTGEVLWSQRGLKRATLTLAQGHLLVLGEYGDLVVVEATPERYKERARVELRDDEGRRLIRHPAWSPPAIANGVLYVLGVDRLVALDIAQKRRASAAR